MYFALSTVFIPCDLIYLNLFIRFIQMLSVTKYSTKYICKNYDWFQSNFLNTSSIFHWMEKLLVPLTPLKH